MPTREEVTKAFQSTLGRAPSEAGLQSWMNYRGDFNKAFNTTAQKEINARPPAPAPVAPPPPPPVNSSPKPTTEQVTNAFQSVLNRAPSEAGLKAWTNYNGNDFVKDFNTTAQRELDLKAKIPEQPEQIEGPKPLDSLDQVKQIQDYLNSESDKKIDAMNAQYTQLLSSINNTPPASQAGLLSDNMTRITDQGSPLMDRAQTIANQQMAGRGLLNSSIGIGAAQSALTDQAYKIAQGDTDVDKFNAGEINARNRALLTELANTGRLSMSNNAKLQGSAFDAGNEYLLNNQISSLDTERAKDIAGFENNLAIQLSETEHGQTMQRDMLNYANARSVEMLKQQSGLRAQYLNAYSNIAASDIPASAKNAQLEALQVEIDAATAAVNRYADIEVKKGPDGSYSFDPVYNIGERQREERAADPEYQTLLKRDMEQVVGTVNKIYDQVRVGGGDSPEESLIDKWRIGLAEAEKSPYRLDEFMQVYREHGMNNGNWQETIEKMNAISRPWVLEERKKQEDNLRYLSE